MYAKSLSMGQWLEAYLINPSDFHLSFDFEGGEIEASYLNIRNHKFLLPLPDLFSPSDDFDQADLISFLYFIVEEFEEEVRFSISRESTKAKAILDKSKLYRDQLSVLGISKKASSQASWSILAGGVSDARVEAYKLRIAITQMVEALKDSPAIEEIYRLCGDTFLTIPDVLSNIERHLDKTNYALITMGADFYRQRLPHSDRETVDIASKYNPAPPASRMINSEMSKEAGSFGGLWSEIADLISEKLEQGEGEITISRKELSDPKVFADLSSLEGEGLVQSFGSYVVVTQKGIGEFLN